MDIVIPDMLPAKTDTQPRTHYEFIAQPLQFGTPTNVFNNSIERENDGTVEKEIPSTYINVDRGLDAQAELSFDITEEIVETEDILIDKISYTETEQSSDPLSLCSILDEIPDGSDYVDNDNVQLYLECSDDNENSSHEYFSKFKPSRSNAEATSQIKMDTQFKISFPSVPERALKCSLCNLLFLSKDFLREHTIINHSKQFYFCNLCPYFTKSMKFYNTHIQTRHKQCFSPVQGQSECLKLTVAAAQVTDKNSVAETRYIESEPESVNTDELNISDERSSYISIDETRKDDEIVKVYETQKGPSLRKVEQNVKCELCEFKTKSKRLLNYHMQAMHNKDRVVFHCSNCEYTCLQRRSFQSHLKRHTGVFEFQCKTCDKKFVSKHLLTKHVRNHRNESIKWKTNSSTFRDNDVNQPVERTEANQVFVRNNSTQTKLARTGFIQATNSDYSKSIEPKLHLSSLKCNTKKFKCTFNGCSKIFRDSFNLRKHLAVHSKSRS
ncbi:zinc finger Y-chromosomal protein 1-like [Mercenaria mercenaria]|uniref:zinc finger Y-chromosomal protein 1-like n=1 Tax=Mercenaria mercenaria TaxID=6596 RepID=UPI00234E8575|nr:zinc finger Y-chromosomal protein 1-like [Mercenaria mercenaria]